MLPPYDKSYIFCSAMNPTFVWAMSPKPTTYNIKFPKTKFVVILRAGNPQFGTYLIDREEFDYAFGLTLTSFISKILKYCIFFRILKNYLFKIGFQGLIAGKTWQAILSLPEVKSYNFFKQRNICFLHIS